MFVLVLLSLLTVHPERTRGAEMHRFVLEVGGLPVAELRVSLNEDQYVYESTHYLEEGPREHKVTLRLKKGEPQPEVLALLHRPKPGCRDVLEERKRLVEQLCVESAEPIHGTIAGEPFEARYDDADRLVAITVGSAKWVKMGSPSAPPPESPFVKGVAVPPGKLTLEPPVPDARWLTRPPVGVGTEDQVGRVRCLVLARAEQARRPGSRVSVGVVIEEDRAYPHAWVTAGEEAFDPSVLAGDPLLAKRRYLEVPREQAGSFYLRLFDGALKLKAK